MNKRFSTLMVAFMAMGSMLTSAMADNAYTEEATAHSVTVDKLVPGRAYYIATITTASELSTSDNFLSITKGSEDDPALTIGNTAVAAAGEIPDLSTNDKKAQWFVTKEAGTNYLTFTNGNGVVLGFKVDGTNAGKVSETKITKFQAVGTGLKAVGVSDASKNFLKVGTTTNLALENTTTIIAFFEARNTAVEVADLQSAVGDNFSLNFANAPKGDSIFAKVTAVTVTCSGDGAKYKTAMATTGQAFYLMVEGEPTDGAFALGDGSALVDKFEKAKFIVLTANRLSSSEFANAANGYKYAVMTGKELREAVTASSPAISAANAQYLAYTTLNQEGYILQQDGVKVSSAAADAKVWVDMIKIGETEYVASKVVDVHKTPVKIEAGKGTAVDVKELVKGKLVVNVLVEKTPSERNFLSALGLADNNGNVAIIDKKAEASLSYPAGQWLVSVNTTDKSKIDLINLQNPSKTESSVALYKTANANEYAVKGGTTLDDKTIKFATISSPNLYNGYLNLNDKDLAGKTYKLKANTSLLDMDVTAYLKAVDAAVKVTQLENEATEWTIEKMVEGVTSTHVKTDTLYITTTYHSYNAAGELKKNEDAVIGIAFGYKLKAVGAADANSELVDWGLGNVDAAKTIMFKQVAAGKYVMVAKSSNDVTISEMNTLGNYAAIGSADGTLKANETAFSNATQFELVEVAPAPSLEADSKHVTFQVNGINYFAVDKNLNGVVANETSELKAATTADFTFYIDSIYSDAVTPKFFIAHAGMMMCNASYVVDTITAAFDNDEITEAEKDAAIAACKVNDNNRVKFVAAKRIADSDSLVISGDSIAATQAFRFAIVESEDGGYVLKNGTDYVGNIGTQLILVSDPTLATSVEVDAAEAPTANDPISASTIQVIAGDGAVQVIGAQGKKVVVSNILGQAVANTVATSDDATIAAPAGVVVVAVEGETAVKAIVK